MSHTIAVAGKGGTGKTTLCGLMIDYLAKSGRSPILAVDADANSNLNEVLGVRTEATLGDLREEVATADLSPESPVPAGMSKQEYMDYKFSLALTEEDDYDLLVMGRTQGKGCYCFVNGLLQSQISKLAGNYKYVIVDNEAGMEHISRGVLPSVDTALLVSDCSRRGIEAAARIASLIEVMNMRPKTVKLIVNRVPGGKLDGGVLEAVEKSGLTLAGAVPDDELIYRYDCDGKPTVSLPDDSPSKSALFKILEDLKL